MTQVAAKSITQLVAISDAVEKINEILLNEYGQRRMAKIVQCVVLTRYLYFNF